MARVKRPIFKAMSYTVGRPGGCVDHVSTLPMALKHAVANGSGHPDRVIATAFGFYAIIFDKPGWALYSANRQELVDIITSYVRDPAANLPRPPAPVPVA